MKKLAVLFCALCVLGLPAFAGIDQGIDKGMIHLSVMGGFAAPVAEYEGDIAYGGNAPTYGAQLMLHGTQYFGIGAEFNMAKFEKEKTAGVDYSADVMRFLVAMKFTFAPEAKTRFYIPLGVGMAKYKGKATGGEESCTKPAAYAGLGVESDLNDIFIIGGEARYNAWAVDKEKFNDTKYLSDVSLLLKVGIKF